MAAHINIEDILETLDQAERDEVQKPTFIEPLKLCLEGLNNIPEMTGLSKMKLIEVFRARAVQRAKVEKAVLENPDILNTPINPVVIIGMARTGTTMLQRLLASSPNIVSPMMFEMMRPCPPGRPDNWRECEKYLTVKKKFEAFLPSSEDDMKKLNSKHNLMLEAPEECNFILQNYFLEPQMPRLPTMEKYRHFHFHPPEEHLKETYDFYKKALQCIFYKGLNEGQILLLKAPLHTLYLDMYRRVFPTAKFIFPYRNIYEMVASGCSLFSESLRPFQLECPKEAIKRNGLEFYRLGSSRVVKTLKSMPMESFIKIPYSELMKDPMAAAKDIHSHFGWDMTQEAVRCMQSHLQVNRQHKFGDHKHSLEQYGITEQEVRENLAEYLDYLGEEKLV